MKLPYKIFYLFLLFVSASAQAEEDYYLYGGIGSIDHFYSTNLGESLESIPNTERSQKLYQASAYFPLHQTLIGVSFNMSFDDYDIRNSTSTLSATQTFYAISMMQFFGDTEGIFLRGDYGLASLSTESTLSLDSSEQGTGYLVGGGYSLPVGDTSRILIGVNYTSNSIDNETYSSLNYTIGMLW